jgi:hypothetical protein
MTYAWIGLREAAEVWTDASSHQVATGLGIALDGIPDVKLSQVIHSIPTEAPADSQSD